MEESWFRICKCLLWKSSSTGLEDVGKSFECDLAADCPSEDQVS